MFLGVTGDVRIDDPPMEPIWAAANEPAFGVSSFRTLGRLNDTHHDKTAISFWRDRAVRLPSRDLERHRRPLPELADRGSRSRLLLGTRFSGAD